MSRVFVADLTTGDKWLFQTISEFPAPFQVLGGRLRDRKLAAQSIDLGHEREVAVNGSTMFDEAGS
jgi:hypothetical protein